MQRLADELVFSFDGDAAGRKAAWRALEVSLPLAGDAKPIRFLFLPPEHDPDSYIRAHGREGFEQLVRAAPTLSEFLIAELRSEFDLDKPEGRAGLLVASKAHLAKLAAPALRMQLVREFAALARVSAEDVERLIGPAAAPAFHRPAPARAAPPISAPQERNLLRCILAKPALAAELEAALLDPELPESGALRAIAELGEGNSANAALLVDRFQGTEFEQTVYQAQAAVLQQDLGEESAEHDFRQIQLALRIRRKNEEIERLKGRVKTEPGLNAELGMRVKELHQLKSQRI